MKKAYELIATLFGLGYFPLAPGTIGSLAGLIVCLPLHSNITLYSSVFLVLFFTGVVSADKVVKITGLSDPVAVIIDEFACVFAVYLFIPLKPFTIILGFILYRVIDVIKPPPIRRIERIKGGWGIMLDDLAAAIYTNLILRILC